MSAPGEEVKLEKVRVRNDVTVASIDAVVAGPPRIRGGLLDIERASVPQATTTADCRTVDWATWQVHVACVTLAL